MIKRDDWSSHAYPDIPGRRVYQRAVYGQSCSGVPAGQLEDAFLQSIAAENNLSETAFLVKDGARYQLRWMTPITEVALCGHATLAAAFVIFKENMGSKRKYGVSKPAMIHTSETDDEVNISCYMWWENFPTFFHLHTPEGDALQVERENVMRRILTIDSLACKESVIHGFGHLLEDRPEVAETALSECVMNAALKPELREYARSMLTGGRV